MTELLTLHIPLKSLDCTTIRIEPGVASSPELISTRICVLLTNWNGRSLPFTNTCMDGVKPLPLTVIVSPDPRDVTTVGAVERIVGEEKQTLAPQPAPNSASASARTAPTRTKTGIRKASLEELAEITADDLRDGNSGCIADLNTYRILCFSENLRILT